jgi:hypothetical protein
LAWPASKNTGGDLQGYEILKGGTVAATVNIASNDGTANPYTFAVQGTGLETPLPFRRQWGSAGNAPGQFADPYGVATDSLGNLYVVDGNNHRVQVFDRTGNFVTQWNTSASSNGQTASPYALAVDSRDPNAIVIYLVDTSNHLVKKFDSTGALLTFWGAYGSAAEQFNKPTGVAVDGSGNVYVVDSFNHRVQQFDSTGAFLAQWGSSGSADGEFMLPTGIAVDSSGNVYVADSLNQRIQKFTSSGSFLAQWGSFGNGVGQLDRPVGVAVDGSGNLYVTDSGNHRLLKFTADGSLLAQWGGYGSAAGEFALPNGVATDSDGNLYVADTGNQRIQQFGPVAAIAVTGNSIPLVNNDTTPAPSDDTDFGSVTSGGTPVVHTFTIGNNGASNLTLYHAALVTVNEGISVTTPSSVIVTISDSDAFTVTTQPTNTVAPNGTTNFAISFAPTTAGVYTATVRIASNDHNDPLFSFVVEGTASITTAARLNIVGQRAPNGGHFADTSNNSDFGVMLIGSTVTRTYALSNTGNADLTVNAITLSNGTANAFALSGVNLPLTIAAGSSSTFSVRLTPSAIGLFTTTVSITSNDNSQPSLAFAVQGTAKSIPAPEINVQGQGVSITSGHTTPDAGNGTSFGSITVGNSFTRTYTVSNTGNTDLVVSAITLNDGQNAAFAVRNVSLPLTVTAGSSAAFTVSLTPGAVGVYTTTVNIASNDADENPYTFVVEGTGIAVTETTVSLASGQLTITDGNGGVSNDTLTLTLNGSNLRINDPANTVGGSGTGVVQVDANTVDVPLANITDGLTIDTLAGTDTVNLNATLALGAGDLVVTAHTINVNAPVSVTGSADITLTARQQIVVNSGADLTTVDGDLTMNANQGVTTTSGDYKGLTVQAALVATGAGNITLNGRGGPDGNGNHGVAVENSSSKVQSASGAITMQGQGGGNNGGWNYGLLLSQSTVTNNTGAIHLVGTGGTSGGRNVGLYLESTVISSTADGSAVGNVTLQGTGGAPAEGDNFGIQMRGSNRINSVAGDVALIGAGGVNSTNNGWGIFIENNGSINSTGTGANAATITITGTASSGNGAAGLFFVYGGATINTVDGALTINGSSTSSGSDPNSVVFWPARLYATGSGAITINAASTHATDFVTLSGDTVIDSGPADLTLRVNTIAMIDGNLRGSGNLLIAPRTAGTSIGIGDGSGTLNVGDGQLSKITDGFNSITIGDATSGPVEINTATFRDPVTIIGSVIRDRSGADLDAATNAVTLVGTVAPGQSPGILNVTGNVALAANDTFAVEIGGATPGEDSSNHDQINAVGTVTIGDPVTLTLTAVNSYTPLPGATYHLIANDGSDAVIGRFRGLPEGATLANFLGSSHNATISYQGGDGNDVVITVNMADIAVQGQGVTIANGDDTPSSADGTDFGSVTVNSGTVMRTFTISNTGTGALTLSGSPLVNVTGSSAFSVSSQPASSSVAAGGSTTFAVTFAPTISGTITATVSIASNDSDENPYTFVVQGAAAGQINRGSQVTQPSFTALYQATPQACANEPAPGLPIHALTPTLLNNTSNSYRSLYFVVTELGYSATQGSNVPTLCNADGSNGGGVGARVTATAAGLSDGFNPNESFTQAFQVGLPVRARYRLFVNLYALPTTVTAADSAAANLIGVLSWEFDENGNLITSRQVFLPLVAR